MMRPPLREHACIVCWVSLEGECLLSLLWGIAYLCVLDTRGLVSEAIHLMRTWTFDMDAQLVQWITSLTSPRRREEARRDASSSGGDGAAAVVLSTMTATSPLDLSPSEITLSDEDHIVFQRLPVRCVVLHVCYCIKSCDGSCRVLL